MFKELVNLKDWSQGLYFSFICSKAVEQWLNDLRFLLFTCISCSLISSLLPTVEIPSLSPFSKEKDAVVN